MAACLATLVNPYGLDMWRVIERIVDADAVPADILHRLNHGVSDLRAGATATRGFQPWGAPKTLEEGKKLPGR